MGNDPFLYCEVHCDLWQSGCKRCEECCQHHYGMSVNKKFNDDGSIEQRSENWQVFTGDSFDNMKRVHPKTILEPESEA